MDLSDDLREMSREMRRQLREGRHRAWVKAGFKDGKPEWTSGDVIGIEASDHGRSRVLRVEFYEPVEYVEGYIERLRAQYERRSARQG